MRPIFESILEAVVEPVLAGLGRVVGFVAIYVLGVPAMCLLATPLVLINALFGEGRYFQKVGAGYKGVCAALISSESTPPST
jgi:hypothetical protein